MTLLAITQLNSQNDIDENFVQVDALIQQARAQHAELIVLPENFACFAAGKQPETAQRFEDLEQRIQQLAFKYQMWIIAGTLPCPFRPDGSVIADGRVRTVSLCLSPEGKTVARYDKIHLFDVQVADGIGGYQESRVFEPGDRVVLADTPFGKIGLMVCYDLRFPELALQLRAQGANLLSAPAAFTYTTGQMHWQLLLQSRAIDTQCQLLGAAQQGWHSHGKRQTWGHSMATHSNGKILGEISAEGNQVMVVPFELGEQQQIREAMPLLQHRRLMAL
jgi:predicted amidohydrolase